MNQRGNAAILTVIVFCAISIVVLLFFAMPMWNVWRMGLSGEANLKKAEQEKQIMIEQAKAEVEAAQHRAKAIEIVGEMAARFPEYRTQEFIGAFAAAMENGDIDKIIYVPTETNIPIVEATRLAKGD